MSSGTAAVQLAIQGCSIGNGDEILVPSMTYVATFQAIKAAGAEPIACDIDENTCLIDLKDASSKISKRTKAIIPVHLYGQPADLDSISNFCIKHNLFLIEDASQAHGAKYREQRLGSIGDIGCFSCYPTKNLGAIGDAGLITTNDSDLENKIEVFKLIK